MSLNFLIIVFFLILVYYYSNDVKTAKKFNYNYFLVK